MTSALPEPSVPPEVYDEEYYRTRCAGHADWTDSEGARVSGIYPGFLKHAGLLPGETVVDLGAGRGELLVTAVEMGASHAYGVEYSTAALGMAERTIEVHGVGDRADVVLADARAVPLPDEFADLVCFVDVVEHLSPEELQAALGEARRMLRPGGRVVAHTMPNRLTYDVTYRVLRPLIGRSWPKDPRNHFERAMHVNEQTVRSLRRAFEGADLATRVELGLWVREDFLPSALARRIYRALARTRPLSQLAIADIWAVGLKV